MTLEDLLSTSKAAAYLGLSPSFLNKLRCTGNGPCYAKLGRRVLYRKAELNSWLEASRRRSTSDGGSPVREPAPHNSGGERKVCNH